MDFIIFNITEYEKCISRYISCYVKQFFNNIKENNTCFILK